MHLKKTITKNDVVLIMLSSFNRIDIYNPKYKAFNLNGNIDQEKVSSAQLVNAYRG